MNKKRTNNNFQNAKFIQEFAGDNKIHINSIGIPRISDYEYTQLERFRLGGTYLGTTSDLISFFDALEKNYKSILAFLIIIYNIMSNRIIHSPNHPDPPSISAFAKFSEYEKYDIDDIISPDDRIQIVKANFNSPGFWEVIGEKNPLNQIRKYIQERHERTKDKQFGWDMERQRLEAEIEHQKLSNDLLKLETTREVINQLKLLGASDIEIRHSIQEHYKHLHLLDPHIDSGRITYIEKISENNSEGEDK